MGDLDDLELDLEEPCSLFSFNNHIYLYQEITSKVAVDFNRLLMQIQHDLISTMMQSGLKEPTIEIHINSPGGDLISTFAMVDKIKEVQRGTGMLKVPIKIITHVEGQSTSAASLLSIVGEERVIKKYASMLLHECLSAVSGHHSDIKKHISNLDVHMDIVKDIYLSHSKIKEEEMDKVLKDGKYYTAEQCLEMGLVDRIE